MEDTSSKTVGSRGFAGLPYLGGRNTGKKHLAAQPHRAEDLDDLMRHAVPRGLVKITGSSGTTLSDVNKRALRGGRRDLG